MVDALGLPVGRRDQAFGADPAGDIGDAEPVLELVERVGAEPWSHRFPVHGAVARLVVRRWQQDVERAAAIRRERRVDARWIAGVDRGILAPAAALGDVLEVLGVGLAGVDRVVGQVDGAVEAQVEHDRAAGVALGVERGILLVAAAQVGGHEVLHRPGRVGVDDDLAVAVLDAIDHHAAHLAAIEGQAVDRRRGVDAHAHAACDVGHGLHERIAAARGVPDAVLVLDERQDAEEARALERAHAQVLALEAEREPHERVAEVLAQVRVQRLPRLDARCDLDAVERQQVVEPTHGRLEDRRHRRELAAVVVEEAAEGDAVTGAACLELRDHAGHVLRGVDLHGRSARLAVEQPVHRVEAGELGVIVQGVTGGPDDLLEHVRHHEERGAAVPVEPVLAQAARAPTDTVMGLVDGHLEAAGRQQQRGSQSSRACPDDGDGTFSGD